MNNEAPTNFFIYFSEILGKSVLDKNKRCVGHLCDIAMKIDGEIYPKASQLIIRRGLFRRQFVHVGWEHVTEVDAIVRLDIASRDLPLQRSRPRFDFTLCVDILDQQVIDTDNRKVERVNDVHLLRVKHQLYLAHVDVGLRGLVRRLEWTNAVDALVKLFNSKSSYLIREDLIPWKNARALALGRTKSLVRVDVAKEELSQLHPTELIEIIKDLGKLEKCVLFRALDPVLQRKVFADLATIQQTELIELLEDKEGAALLENIPSDDAADLILKLRKRKANQLMKLVETKTSKKLSKLLKFSSDCAGGLMTTEYLTMPQNSLVKDAWQKIKDNSQFPGSIFYIFLVDEEYHLMGWTSLRWFLNADPETLLLQTCHAQKIFVYTEDKIDKVALLLEKYKFSAVPVVNKDNVLQGIITIDDVMEELISIAWKKHKGRF